MNTLALSKEEVKEILDSNKIYKICESANTSSEDHVYIDARDNIILIQYNGFGKMRRSFGCEFTKADDGKITLQSLSAENNKVGLYNIH